MYYVILSIVVLTVTYVLVGAWRRKNYFKKWGIPTPPESWLTGSTVIFGSRHMNYVYKDMYRADKDAKYLGCHIFGQRIILLRDLDLIKSVLVKNFDSFAHHPEFVEADVDPLFGKNLIFLNGQRWREIRSLLSPAFTSSKMRSMYALMSACAENFVKHFSSMYKDGGDIDMKDVFGKYATDVIATCAYGIEINSLENPNNEFYKTGKRVTTFNYVTFIKFALLRISSKFSKFFNIRVISKEDTDFFVNAVNLAVTTRDEKGITRPDMLQLMMDARDKTKNLNILEMTAQAFVFFLGGFDTISNQMCMISYELAVNPDAQKKLQAEIDLVLKENGGKPTYESINNMPYLDAVFNETLRMHSISFVNRVCSKEFELPPAAPGAKPYVVKVGDEIQVPVVGIHYDDEHYENPDKFDPERFIRMNEKSMTKDTLSLGFGLGPRMCIGNRFAILETKVFFVHLLSKCELKVCEKTCVPLEYSKSTFVATPKGGAWLKIKPRD